MVDELREEDVEGERVWRVGEELWEDVGESWY